MSLISHALGSGDFLTDCVSYRSMASRSIPFSTVTCPGVVGMLCHHVIWQHRIPRSIPQCVAELGIRNPDLWNRRNAWLTDIDICPLYVQWFLVIFTQTQSLLHQRHVLCDMCFHTSIVLYRTVLSSTVLYCTIVYCTVLNFIALYCTTFHCIVLYHTVLYCTVLYCTEL